MTSPPDQDYQNAIADFKRGGWIVSLLGGAGMLARMLLSDESHPLLYWIRKVIAGAIVGVIAYFSLYQVDMSGIHKSIILSTSGALAPELMEFLIKRVKGASNEKPKRTKKKR